ncbi:hypothetical protein D3C77_566040 [compost metagenome]
MHAGDTGLEALDGAAVVDGIQEAGDQVDWLLHAEPTHVLQREPGFRATNGRPVQHGLVDVQTAAPVAGIDKMAHVRPGSAGQIQMPRPAVAEQLLQPMNTVALRPVVDIGAHEIVVTRQVGIESIAGHGDLMC